MAGKKYEIEARLLELELQPKVISKKSSINLFGISLIWPRVAISRKTFAIPLTLKDGRWHGRDRIWSESILFKETVQGRFGLEISLSDGTSNEVVDELLRGMAGQFVKMTGKIAAGDIAPAFFENLSLLPFDQLAKTIAKKRAPKILAVGLQDHNAELLPETGQSVRWEVPILAPDGVYQIKHRQAGGNTIEERRQIVAPGAAAGHCLIEIQSL